MADRFRGPLQGPQFKWDGLQSRKERAQIRESLKQFIRQDPELSEYLNQINFDEIRRILSERLRKSTGGKAKEAHIVPKESIIFSGGQGVRNVGFSEIDAMTYAPEVELILVNLDTIHAVMQSVNFPRPLVFLYYLSHEQGHAASSHYFSSMRKGRVGQIGLEQVYAREGKGKPVSFFKLLSEGVNDKMARENVAAYLRSNPMSGITNADVEDFLNVYSSRRQKLAILTPAHLIEALVANLAKSQNIDPKVVWESLMHAQMNGLDLLHPENQKMIESEIGEGFLDKIAHADEADIMQALKKYHLTEYFDVYVKAVNRTLHKNVE